MALWSDIFTVPTRESQNVGLELLGVIFNPTIVYGETFDPNQSSVFMHTLGAINIFYFVLMVLLLIVIVMSLLWGKGIRILNKEQARESPYRVGMLLCLYFFAFPLPNVGYLNLANYLYVKLQVRGNLVADWIAKHTTLSVIQDTMSQGDFANDVKNPQRDANIGTSADAFFLARFADAVPIFVCADAVDALGILRNNNRAYQALRACHVPSPTAERFQPDGNRYSTNTYGNIVYDHSSANTNYEEQYAIELACHYKAYQTFKSNGYISFENNGSKVVLNNFPTVANVDVSQDGKDYRKDGLGNYLAWRNTSRQIQTCILQTPTFSKMMKFSQDGEIVPVPGSNSTDQIFTETAQKKLNRGWIYYPIYAKNLLDGRQGDYLFNGNFALKSYTEYFGSQILKPNYQVAFGDDVDDVIPSVQKVEATFTNVVESFVKAQGEISEVEARREEDAMLKQAREYSNIEAGHLVQSTASIAILEGRFRRFTDMLYRVTGVSGDGSTLDMKRRADELKAAYKNVPLVQKVRNFRVGLARFANTTRKFISAMVRTNELFNKTTSVLEAQMDSAQKTINSVAGIFGPVGSMIAGAIGTVLTAAGSLVILAKKIVGFSLAAIMHVLRGPEGKILYFLLLLIYGAEYLPMLAVSIAAIILAMQVAAWSVGITLAIIVAPIPNSRVGEGAWRYTLGTFLTPSLIMLMYFLATSMTDFAISYSVGYIFADMDWSSPAGWVESIIGIFTGDVVLRIILSCFIYIFILYQSSKMIVIGSDFILERLGLGYRSEGFAAAFESGVSRFKLGR